MINKGDTKMAKIAFVGFGEVNTPADIIIRKCKAAEDRLNAILAKYDLYTYPEEPTAFDTFLAETLEAASIGLVKWIGGGSLVDWILSPVRNLFNSIFG